MYFRDIQDHVSQLVSRVDGTREMVTKAMQVNRALIDVNQKEVVKGLAVSVTVCEYFYFWRRLRCAGWI